MWSFRESFEIAFLKLGICNASHVHTYFLSRFFFLETRLGASIGRYLRQILARPLSAEGL